MKLLKILLNCNKWLMWNRDFSLYNVFLTVYAVVEAAGDAIFVIGVKFSSNCSVMVSLYDNPNSRILYSRNGRYFVGTAVNTFSKHVFHIM